MHRHNEIGRYKVESLLGEGAMGSVYKAFDPKLQRMLAIKTIKPDKSRNSAEIEEFHKRFIQEAQISGILQHPNIVSIFDIGTHEDMPFIAMEFVEGLTLGDLIRRNPAPTYGEIIQVLMQISSALDFAHTKGIVHRDLKPGNIMVMPNGTAKIMDFGIAKRTDSTLTQTGVFLGTPSYSSPEQIRVGHVDSRSDIFSFGILTHESLTGQLPFPGNNINMILYKIAHEPPELASNLDSLPVDVVVWREAFNKVLHKDPTQRFPTATAFVKQLYKSFRLSQEESIRVGAFLGQMGTTFQNAFNSGKNPTIPVESDQLPSFPAGSDAPTVRTSPPQKKKPLGLFIGVGIATAIAMAAFFLNSGSKQAPEPTQIQDTSSQAPGSDSTKTSETSAGSLTSPQATATDAAAGAVMEKVLNLRSEPEGADVSLNGKKLGATPMNYSWQAPEGTTAVFHFEKSGFRAMDLKLTLDKKLNSSVRAQLSAQGLARTIESSPKGARISIDGKPRGTAPLDFEFQPGRAYQIGANAPGRQPLQLSYTEGRDNPSLLKLELPTLAPPGTLKLDSLMDDLRVSLNGKPLSGSSFQLPAGEHPLILESDKYYYRESRKVLLEPGQTQVLQTPLVLTIPKIDFSPGYAQVRIDGRFVKNGGENDTTPIAGLRIASGIHAFEFVSPGGKILKSLSIEVKKSEPITVSADR